MATSEGDDRCASEADSLPHAAAKAPAGAPAQALYPGALIAARFRLERQLGAGGMGVVWAACHVITRKPMALKFIRGGGSGLARERFLREARASCAVRHPAVVEVYDVLELADGLPVIVMELLAGETLAARLAREGAMALPDVARVMVPVCSALRAAHVVGIVHRDLKPDNVMLAVEGDGSTAVKVLDFGIAKVRTSERSETESGQSTETGVIVGTPYYMAPEQLFAERDVDERADLWAIGVILYEALSGRRPVQGENLGQILKAIGQGGIVPLREVAPAVPAHVADLVARLLEPDRERRLADMREVLGVLSEHAGVTTAPETAARRASEARAHNLPANAMALVGRDPLLAELRALLRRPDVRLLTLSGPGGIGKTRLATQLVSDVACEHEHGAWFIELAPIRDASLVLPTIAATMGVVPDQLLGWLRGRELVLLLDNFEQVLEAADGVAQILAVAPRVKLVVTSRSPLRVRGERDHPVPPLCIPTDPGAPAAAECDSVHLFTERALAANPRLALTPESVEAIAAVCTHLDGLPLAIELAAARMRVLTPAAMHARLTVGSLAVLTGGARDAPARQKTLRDTIAWSHDLLDDAGRVAFRRLSVFRGGCDLAAAAAVLGESEEAALGQLESLLDQSLVRVVEHEAEPRFVMLETIREFAREKLEASGEAQSVRDLHAAYYAALAESSRPSLRGPESSRTYARLTRELDNLRSALSGALSRADTSLTLRLVVALTPLWDLQGLAREGAERLDAALALQGEAVSVGRAAAELARGRMHRSLGELGPMRVRTESALATFRAAGDRQGVFDALEAVFWHHRMSHDLTGMTRVVDEMRAESAASGEARAVALADFGAAWLAHSLGDLERAEAAQRRALASMRAVGDVYQICILQVLLGEMQRARGDHAKAALNYEQSLDIGQRLGWQFMVAVCLGNLSTCRRRLGDATGARTLIARALRLYEKMGDAPNVANLILHLGGHAHEEHAALGARLFGAGERWFEEHRIKLLVADRIEVESIERDLRLTLGDAAFEAGRDAGRNLSGPETVAEALALSRDW